MRWEQGWSKQLCFVSSKNLKFYGKRLQQRSYSLFKGPVYENIRRYYDKDFKVTSLSQYSRFYCQIWKCWDLFRKPIAQINSQNLGNFQEKYQLWSFVIVKPLPLRFTVILLMFLKLMILWNFIMIYEDLLLILLILVSSQPYLNLK